jgi:A/G-specific adenine glycosylase
MAVWSGLGYYARARNLHACARRVVADHGGHFPTHPEAIAALPGIGRSTAAAIATFAFGTRAAILDGNVKRVLCRVFGIDGFPGQAAVERRLWDLANQVLPDKELPTYIQAQMDLGATVCVRGTPKCDRCPLQDICVARQSGRTTALPAARPRKEQPLKTTRMAVITDGRSVLLVRRPPQGIWGGLLSLPEFDTALSAHTWWQTIAGDHPAQIMALPGLRHTFTHFRLDIAPTRFEVPDFDGLTLSPAQQVVPLTPLDALGLPTPVRRILDAL